VHGDRRLAHSGQTGDHRQRRPLGGDPVEPFEDVFAAGVSPEPVSGGGQFAV
jgi:hypothetical protein